ncbi:predicted protein [Nematostella vectensis]|uniref:Uncharacterized protein n=1 Tax=Nematostella vectensis TaxID=45351 RepID=A7SDR9_NEMVE|nr:predicted protein [Nematostella vectensis]|eukprot:XP_001630223.1 predicted protein [Nematostella vectensis]
MAGVLRVVFGFNKRFIWLGCINYGSKKTTQKSHASNTSSKTTSPSHRTLKQKPIGELFSLHIGSNNQNNVYPLDLLLALAQSTRRSLKQSYLLLSDTELQRGYSELLSKITDSLGKVSLDELMKSLLAIAQICQRQDVFLDLNETRISLHPQESKELTTCATYLTKQAVVLFKKAEGILLDNRFGGIPNSWLTTVLWAYTVTGQGSDELLHVIKSEVLNRELETFHESELVQVLDSFCMAPAFNSEDVFGYIHQEVMRRGLIGFKTCELPVLMYSFVSQDSTVFSPEFYQRIKIDLLGRDVRVITPVELSKLFWSFARVKSNVDSIDVIKYLQKELLRRGLSKFDDRGVAVLMWSLIELNFFSKELFNLLKREICRRNQRTFSSHDISIIFWCFAKIKNRFDSRVIFAMFDKELHHRGFAAFSHSELAMTLWSFAELDQGTRATLTKLTTEIQNRDIKEFKPVLISQLIWGFAKVRNRVDVIDALRFLSSKLSKEVAIQKFTMRQLALMLWSLAVSDHMSPLLKSLQLEVCKRSKQTINNATLCQLLFSLAESGDLVDGVLTRHVLGEVSRRGFQSFQNLQLSAAAWAISELLDCGHPGSELVHLLEDEIQRRNISEFKPADLCRIFHALARFKGILQSGRALKKFRDEILKAGLDRFSIGELLMITVAQINVYEPTDMSLQSLRSEVLSRNPREFAATHLCIIAQYFPDPEVRSWLEKEVIGRSVTAFTADELKVLLQTLARDEKLCTSLRQQLEANDMRLYGYSDCELEEIEDFLKGEKLLS